MCKTHQKYRCASYTSNGVLAGTNVAHHIWCVGHTLFFTVRRCLLKPQPSLSLRLDKYQNIATALSFDNVSVMRCFIFDNVFVMRYSIFNNNAKSRPLRVIIINK